MGERQETLLGSLPKLPPRAGALASEVQRPTGVFKRPSLSALSGPNDPDDGPPGLEWKKNIKPCLLGVRFRERVGRCAWAIWIVMRRVRANRQDLGKETLFSPYMAAWRVICGRKHEGKMAALRGYSAQRTRDSQFRAVRLHSTDPAKIS